MNDGVRAPGSQTMAAWDGVIAHLKLHWGVRSGPFRHTKNAADSVVTRNWLAIVVMSRADGIETLEHEQVLWVDWRRKKFD